jgi:hypothetical protein
MLQAAQLAFRALTLMGVVWLLTGMDWIMVANDISQAVEDAKRYGMKRVAVLICGLERSVRRSVANTS